MKVFTVLKPVCSVDTTIYQHISACLAKRQNVRIALYGGQVFREMTNGLRVWKQHQLAEITVAENSHCGSAT